MGAYRKLDSSSQGGGSRSSSLEGLLQQAWLQSQSRPKVARRSVSDPLTDVAASTSSQSFAQLMSGAGEVDMPEESYFHKTRSEEVPEFFRRRAIPRLQSYSTKTQVPRSRAAGAAVEGRNSVTSVGDGVSQDSGSSTFSSSESGLSNSSSYGLSNDTHASMDELFDAVDSADLGLEQEVLSRYFDEILCRGRLDLEKCLMQVTTASLATKKKIDDLVTYSAVDDCFNPDAADVERWNYAESLTYEEMQTMIQKSSAYQAIAEEIASLLSSEPTIHDISECGVEDHENSSGAAIFAPSEEESALKIMEGFTYMMSKHIQDVSICNSDTVDYRTWITEDPDRIDASFNDAWKTYFENWHQSFPTPSSLESNLLLGAGSNLSQASAEAFPSCNNMTELLYRYGHLS
jgi:hypothetical protein